jgi:membrane-bound lytic murein transglycosylase D
MCVPPRRLLAVFLLTIALACGCAAQSKERRLLQDNLPTSPAGRPQVAASDQDFLALKEKIRTLTQEAVELTKKGQQKKGEDKIEQARMAILTFQGTDRQREELAEEYDLLLTLLDEIIEPEKRTPNDAVTLMLPPEPTEQEMASVDAAKSIRSLRRYLDHLPPDARRRIARQLAVFTRTDRGRLLFQRYLDRSALYRERIARTLAANKLPAELFYVALIESGFSEVAISRTGAAGLWQFMPATARDYGMQVDRWVDQRLDWIRATDGAAHYFRDSLDAFSGNIELAVASYNTGVGNVRKAMRRGGADNFWDLRLHPETMDYVPKWIAAMILCANASRFGFTVPADAPQKFDAVTVRGSLQLEVVASATGQPPETIAALNRALIRGATPPDRPWALRLPPGSREKLVANLDNLMQSSAVVWVAHRMQKGESLPDVALRFNVTIERLVAANQSLNDHLPDEGEVIMVPAPANNPAALAEIQQQEEEQRLLASLQNQSPATPARATAAGPEATPEATPEARPAAAAAAPPANPAPRRVVHRVRPNDNLWMIADRYDVDLDDVREWNKDKIGANDEIRPGQRLTIWVGGEAPPPEAAKYTVRRGDTLGKIATHAGLDLKTLAAFNSLTADSTIYPGMQLKIPAKGQKPAAPATPATYTVSRGDTMAKIAARFGITAEALEAENQLDDPDDLRVGQTLSIPQDANAAATPEPAPAPRTVHVVKRGETLAKIAHAYGVTAKDLAAANDLAAGDRVHAGQKLEIPDSSTAPPKKTKAKEKWIKYKVRAGDSLRAIADKYGCEIDDLEEWNNIRRSRPIQPGQMLKILASPE